MSSVKFKNLIKILFLLIFIFLIYSYRSYLVRVAYTPYAVTSMYAKEYCTCRFVLPQTHEYCILRVKRLYSLFDVKLEVDESSKTVHSKFLFYSSKSFFKDERRGCGLL